MATQAVQRIEQAIKDRHGEIDTRRTQFTATPTSDIAGREWIKAEGQRCLGDIATFTKAAETGQFDAIAMCVNETHNKCLLAHMGFDGCGFDHKQCPWIVNPDMAQERLQ